MQSFTLSRLPEIIFGAGRIADLAGKKWRLQDRLSPASYEWNGGDLVTHGLYLDMTPWQSAAYVLELA